MTQHIADCDPSISARLIDSSQLYHCMDSECGQLFETLERAQEHFRGIQDVVTSDLSETTTKDRMVKKPRGALDLTKCTRCRLDKLMQVSLLSSEYVTVDKAATEDHCLQNPHI